MPVPLAELFISVSADITNAVSGLNQINTQLGNTTNAFRTAQPAALAFEAAAAAIGAGLGTSIKVAADFEHQMSGIKAVMTPDEVNTFGAALSDLALKLGRDTVFTSREAAAGIEELIKAGIPAEAVLNGAGAAALSLAAATGIPVAQAATIAAQAMNAFHLSAGDLDGVVDILAGTVNASAADMTDLQQGLQVVSATAQTMGLTFNDTAAAIGLFTNSGETGATAGTGLRQMLLELIPTTKPAKDEMIKLGLATKDGGNAFFDAAGHVKNMAEVSQILQDALKGMSDEQKIAALNTLFTRDAINSASILASNGALGFEQLTGSIGQISAVDAQKTRLDNLQGALNNLGGSVETVQILVGNLFLPTLKKLADFTRGVVDQFSRLSPEVQKGIVVFTAITGAVLGIVGTFVLLAPAISALPAAFGALSGIIAGIAPILLIVAGAAIGFKVAWENNFGGIQGIVQGALDRVGPILGNLGLVAQKALSGDFVGAFDTFRATAVALAPPLGRLFTLFDGIGNFIATQVVPGAADLADRIFPVLKGVTEGVAEAWDTKLKGPLGIVGGILRDILVDNFQKLVAALPTLEGASQTLATFWDTKLKDAFTNIGTYIDGTLLKSLGDLGNGLSNLTTDKVTATAELFGGAMLQSFSKFGNELAPLVGVFQSVGGFLASVVNLFSAIAELQARGQQGAGATDPLTANLQRFIDLVAANQDFGANFRRFLGPVGDILENATQITSAFNGMADALNKFAAAVRGIGTLPDWLQKLIAGNVIGSLGSAGQGLADRVTGSNPTPTAFNRNVPFGPGANSAGGAILNFNAPININGAGDFANFIDSVANAVNNSTRRINPPVPQGQPGLVASTV